MIAAWGSRIPLHFLRTTSLRSDRSASKTPDPIRESESQMSFFSKLVSIVALTILVSFSVYAKGSITVLDFELNDVTSNPGVAEEVERTASLKRLLEESLSAKDYPIVSIDPAAQAEANKGFGYLWDHSDEAAMLGKASGSDFVIVGRL